MSRFGLCCVAVEGFQWRATVNTHWHSGSSIQAIVSAVCGECVALAAVMNEPRHRGVRVGAIARFVTIPFMGMFIP